MDIYGERNFPLIMQYYYPNYSEICITPGTPMFKSFLSHEGYGKIRVKDHHDKLI